MKITFKQARETLPAPIAKKAVEMCQQEHIRQIGIRHSKSLYFAEDARYYAYHPQTNDWAYLECGGEWNGYKVNDPINKTTEIPVGAYVIEKEFFLGKPFVTVIHNNGIELLTQGAK